MGSFLITWIPALILIAIPIFFMMRAGAFSYPKHVQETKSLAVEQLNEMKKISDSLLRIEALLREKR